MTPEQLLLVKHYAEDAHPFECCGVVGWDGAVVPCDNAAADRTKAFLITGRDLKRVELEHGGIFGIFHSHIDASAWPSSADAAQAPVGVPYFIVVVRRGIAREVREYILGPDRRFRPVTAYGK